jgi:hypothetical protein
MTDERCLCASEDCPRCRPALQRDAECATCGNVFALWQCHECRRCGATVCDACLLRDGGRCEECAKEAGG